MGKDVWLVVDPINESPSRDGWHPRATELHLYAESDRPDVSLPRSLKQSPCVSLHH